MPSMSYCVFENTYPDLQTICNKLEEAGSLENLKEDLSKDELRYVDRVIDLCRNIVDLADEGGDEGEFDDEEDEDDDSYENDAKFL